MAEGGRGVGRDCGEGLEDGWEVVSGDGGGRELLVPVLKGLVVSEREGAAVRGVGLLGELGLVTGGDQGRRGGE